MQAVLVVLLGPPGGVEAAWKEEGIVCVLSEVVFEVVFPRFELLEGKPVGGELFRGTELEVSHSGRVVGGGRGSWWNEALPPR